MMPLAYSQRKICVGDIIHKEFVKSHEKDMLYEWRKNVPFANNIKISGDSDTIYVIEELAYSEYEPSGYFSYWNRHSLFSARQEEVEGYVFKIKNENLYPRWLMQNVQAWNIDSLTALGQPKPLEDHQIAGTYYAYRIIVNKEKVIVNSVKFYPRVKDISESEEESDELYYRWFDLDLDDDDD